MTNTHSSNTSPADNQEPFIRAQSSSRRPITTSPEPKRQRLEPVNYPIVPEENIHPRHRGNLSNWSWFPSQIIQWIRQEQVPAPRTITTPPSTSVLPPLPCSWEQAFAALVAIVCRDIGPIQLAAFKVDQIFGRFKDTKNQIKGLKEELESVRTSYDHLFESYEELTAQVKELTKSVTTANERIAATEARVAEANVRTVAATERADMAHAIATQALQALAEALNPEPVEEEPEEVPEEEEEPEEVPEEEEDEDSDVSSVESN